MKEKLKKGKREGRHDVEIIKKHSQKRKEKKSHCGKRWKRQSISLSVLKAPLLVEPVYVCTDSRNWWARYTQFSHAPTVKTATIAI